METLRVIVKSILLIIMISAFLEILLPRSDMKRYINLIIGLFVIIAVLNPFLSLINKDISFDVIDLATIGRNADTENIINKGKVMAADQKKAALNTYKQKLEKQITSLSGMIKGTIITGVEIEMIEDPADSRFGQVKRIVVRSESGGLKGTGENVYSSGIYVDEIGVNDINAKSGLEAKGGIREDRSGDATESLRDMIAGFYGLSPDQVVIE